MQLTLKNKNYDVLISELKRVNDNKDTFNEEEIKLFLSAEVAKWLRRQPAKLLLR